MSAARRAPAWSCRSGWANACRRGATWASSSAVPTDSRREVLAACRRALVAVGADPAACAGARGVRRTDLSRRYAARRPPLSSRMNTPPPTPSCWPPLRPAGANCCTQIGVPHEVLAVGHRRIGAGWRGARRAGAAPGARQGAGRKDRAMAGTARAGRGHRGGARRRRSSASRAMRPTRVRMLAALSGRTHQVMTAVALALPGGGPCATR